MATQPFKFDIKTVANRFGIDVAKSRKEEEERKKKEAEKRAAEAAKKRLVFDVSEPLPTEIERDGKKFKIKYPEGTEERRQQVLNTPSGVNEFAANPFKSLLKSVLRAAPRALYSLKTENYQPKSEVERFILGDQEIESFGKVLKRSVERGQKFGSYLSESSPYNKEGFAGKLDQALFKYGGGALGGATAFLGLGLDLVPVVGGEKKIGQELFEQVASKYGREVAEQIAQKGGKELAETALKEAGDEAVKKIGIEIPQEFKVADDVVPTKSPVAERINYYKERYSAGDPVDAIRVARNERGALEIVDGNQRYQALRQLGLDDVPVVEVTPPRAKAVPKAPQIKAGDTLTNDSGRTFTVQQKPYFANDKNFVYVQDDLTKTTKTIQLDDSYKVTPKDDVGMTFKDTFSKKELVDMEKKSLKFPDPQVESNYQQFKQSLSKFKEIPEDVAQYKKRTGRGTQTDNLLYSQEKTDDEIYEMFVSRFDKERKLLFDLSRGGYKPGTAKAGLSSAEIDAKFKAAIEGRVPATAGKPAESLPLGGQPSPRQKTSRPSAQRADSRQTLVEKADVPYKPVKQTEKQKSMAIKEADKKLSPTNLDPKNSNLYQRAKQAIEDRWISVREKVQDDWNRVRKLMNRKDVKLTEANNVYEKEILYHGRLSARIEDVKDVVTKIDQDVVKTAKTLKMEDSELIDKVNEYLVAKHAPERNAAIGEKAAGMTTEEAARIVKEIESSPIAGEVKRLAAQISDLNKQTLQVLLDGEVISRELFEELTKKYKNHVPLNRIFAESEDIDKALTGAGFDVRATGIKKAKGSDREVADILTNVTANAQEAIIRAEKNRVDLSLLEFVKDNPKITGRSGEALFEIIKPKAIGKTFDDKIILQQINDPQVLTLRSKGKPVYIRINDPKLAVALRGISREHLPTIMRWISTFTRLYSSLATRFNPEFALSNKIRDIQEAAIYTAAQKDMGFGAAATASAKDPSSIKGVLEHMRGKDSPMARLYEQMRKDGGTTGGLGLSTRKQIELDLNHIRKLNRSNPRKAMEYTFKKIDQWNQLFEDSTRLSVYREALARGLSRERAAVLAKNSTINFNKMGTGGPVVNAIWMFSNASIQGSAKMLTAMKNPKVAAATLLTMGTAVTTVNQWNDHVDPEWRDKVSQWDRNSNLVVMLPTTDGSKYITIPVSWGLKPIKVSMDYAYDQSVGKNKGIKDTISGILASTLEAYNPLGGTDLTSTLTPTILDLPVDIARNKAWHGGKIRPDWDPNAPESTKFFKSIKDTTTGRTILKATQFLSSKDIEISPASVQYAYEQLLGGAGRAASRVINSATSIAQGETPPASEVPFLNRFLKFKSAEDLSDSNASFYDIKTEVEGQQSKDKVKAELLFDDIKGMEPKERGAKLQQMIKDGKLSPEVLSQFVKVLEKEASGLSDFEQSMKYSPVEVRAKYILEEVKKLPKDKRAELIRNYAEKKIITPDVVKRIVEELKGEQP